MSPFLISEQLFELLDNCKAVKHGQCIELYAEMHCVILRFIVPAIAQFKAKQTLLLEQSLDSLLSCKVWINYFQFCSRRNLSLQSNGKDTPRKNSAWIEIQETVQIAAHIILTLIDKLLLDTISIDELEFVQSNLVLAMSKKIYLTTKRFVWIL